MQQISRRIPMPKCDFNKVTPFPKNTSGWLLLIVTEQVLHCSYLVAFLHQKRITWIAFSNRFQSAWHSEAGARRYSTKKGVLKNFAKFTGKHLCQRLFFKKVAIKESLAQVFSCKYCKISKNTFFTDHLPTTTSGRINPS